MSDHNAHEVCAVTSGARKIVFDLEQTIVKCPPIERNQLRQSNRTDSTVRNENMVIDESCHMSNDFAIKTQGLKRAIDDVCSASKPACPPKRRKVQNIMAPLSEESISIIRDNKQLTDNHVRYFGQILSNHSDYCHQDTVYLQQPSRIQPLTICQKHIQILYSNWLKDGHWICSYYDGKKIHIYDSLNIHCLHEDHKIFLQHLYPFYTVSDAKVKFEKVQQQTNSVDCGLFAIAFAVSLLFREKPHIIKYDISLMRTHLLEMFQSNEISRFPHISNHNPPTINNLEEIRQKELRAYRQREMRQRSKNTTNSKVCQSSESQNIVDFHNENKKFNEIEVNDNSEKGTRQVKSVLIDEMTKIKENDTTKTDDVETGIGLHTMDTIRIGIPPIAETGKVEKCKKRKDGKQTKGLPRKTLPTCRKSSSKHKSSKPGLENETKHETIKMTISIEECTEKLTYTIAAADHKDTAESKLEANKIVKWCLEKRKSIVNTLNRLSKNVRNTADYYLTRAQVNEYDDHVFDLCGKSRHTSSTEAYFYEMMYSFDDLKHCSIIINSKGQATNILPLVTHKRTKLAWECSIYCKEMANNDILTRYKELLQEVAGQTLRTFPKFLQQTFLPHCENKLGHPAHCYIQLCPCKSLLLAAKMLAPHFPVVRNVIRLLYKINQSFNDLRNIDNALEAPNLEMLRKISDDMKQTGQSFESSTFGNDALNEDQIQEEYKNAFIALNKRSMDVPEFPCISCQKLYCKRSVRVIERLRKEITYPCWDDLLRFVEEKNVYASEYICDYCLNKFRSNRLPPTCILNSLEVSDVPSEISNLNAYEKILIQRAKVFQVVQRAGTVMKKNVPNTMKIQKLKGQSFHLPLPLEQTLGKIAATTDPINEHHELHILVRGIPTKANAVWQKLVSLDKVFRALKWLQEKNPLYREIKLPESAENLMQWITKNDVEFQVESDESEEEVVEDNNVQVNGNKDECQSDDKHGGVASKIVRVMEDGNEGRICEDKSHRPSPMVTQIRDDSAYIEQYTIYPMHDKRVNETSCNLYQMKKVNDRPLNYNAENLDLLCFPDLYPDGVNGQGEQRNETLMDAEYIKVRLCSKESRFRLNQQYLFYLLNNANMRQINSGIYHTLHVTNPRQKYTANTYLDQIRKGELETNMNTVFERLRNSEQFWRQPRNNLSCMARYYGPATWFLTLSPADWLWSDLILYVRRVNSPHLDKLSDGEVVAADPVSVSRFIDNKFHAMLDFLTSENHPIGHIDHYFWRREYQGRGVQHFHLVIWVKNAPIVGVNSNEEVAEFIQKYVTCRLPTQKISPILHRRVTTHQTHKHNSYCLRSKKVESGKVTKKCRFGFPRPISENFVLRDPAVSIAGRKKLKAKSRFYDLPRSETEVNINDYNPTILTAWEGNMDIQFIGESSSLLTQYCTKYSTKYETSKTSTVLQEATSTKTIRQKLWNLGMRGLQNRELGALEAADTLLGISLYGTDPDTTIKWLDVRMVRNRKVKKYNEIKNMDENSTDIFCPSLADDHYPKRPQKLESIYLYDFCKWYETVRVEPKTEGVEYYMLKPYVFLKKRAKPHLINHWRYNVNTQPENFFYALLLLFKPWRNTDDLKGDSTSYTEAFEREKDVLLKACEYLKNLEDFKRGLDFISEKIDDELKKENTQPDSQAPAPQMGCEPKEARAAMQEFQDIDDRIVKSTDLPTMISQMNADQRRVFENVTRTLSSKNEILRLYVSGEGGTGKSFLIDVIRTWINKEMKRKTAVTAPTGIAAFNINGLTIHRYFQLPIEHGQTPKYKQLSDNVLKLLREEMRDVELIIIDEISMVSNLQFMYINLRLMEIFDTFEQSDGWFGKKHILLFGDLLQLPPVAQNPTYVKLSSDEIEKRLGAMSSINLWADLFTYDELTINMRQNKDRAYGELLSRLRTGQISEEDITILRSRKFNIQTSNFAERLRFLAAYIKSLPMNTVCLFATRKLCDCLNTMMLQELASEEIELIAEDSIDCRNARLRGKAMKILDKAEQDDRSSAGLAKHIIIKIGAKVMVRRNIDVTLGLVNGTIAIVTSISKSISKGVEYIKSVNLKLDSGQAYDIERMDVKFEIMDGVYITRRQFPICLSYGITIHKSQGLSLHNVVMDIGNTVFSSGQSYVALSRVTTLQGVHLINFDPSSVKASSAAIQEYNRLRKEYRPDLPQIPVLTKYWSKTWDLRWAFETGVIDGTEDDDEKPNVDSSVVGLCNSNGTSSFVNVVLQCIIHSSVIRQSLLLIGDDGFTEMRTFLKQYVDGRQDLNASNLVQSIGNQFHDTTEQDPILFLETLLDRTYEARKHTQIEFTHLDRCKRCSYTKNSREMSFMITLSLDDMKKTISLNDLMQQNFSKWHETVQYCDQCHDHTTFSRKTSVNSTANILILKLNIFNLNKKNIMQKIQNWRLKAVPTTSVSVSGSTYSVDAAILHHTGNSDHYTCLLRDQKSDWIHVDDAVITKIRWPRNAKDVYILFLQRRDKN